MFPMFMMIPVLADIAHGQVNGAEILFFLAFALFFLAGCLTLSPATRQIALTLIAFGLSSFALGWVIL